MKIDKTNTGGASRGRSVLVITLALLVSLGVTGACAGTAPVSARGPLSLVEKGLRPLPIVIAADAPEETRKAATDLAHYIEKISGARPEIRAGMRPSSASAVWVGIQPGLPEAFPGQDLTFKFPEEILIVCNGSQLLIAGRDAFAGPKQISYGTANAVYTFLEKQLEVRWLWPGELGEDIVRKSTLAILPHEYRFHPPLLRRSVFARAERNSLSQDWARQQRLLLGSMKGQAGGHAYTDWWQRFHRTHPEWFALQPDGSRSGYPSPKHVKICLSNPAVWDQWLADAVAMLEKNPEVSMIMAGENDGHSSGVCVCRNCRAWDHPEGATWNYTWDGRSEKYVATTDRYITYWNQLARKLKERFPDRADLYVQGLAYGPSTPPPVKAVPAKNVVISYVGKFPTIDDNLRQTQKDQFATWAMKAPNIFYRPNLWYWTGGAWGMPDMALTNVSEDFRFLADNHCIGLFVDTAQEHWATQGPQYYLLGQLAWDPTQDAQAVLADYYRRGFGAAAAPIERYWKLMETARGAVTAAPTFGPNARDRFNLLKIFEQVYTPSLFQQAADLLRQAAELTAREPRLYQRRVAFVRTGLEFSQLMVANLPLMTRVRESRGKDREAMERVTANWAAIKKLADAAGPIALNYTGIMSKMTGSGYMGMMEDYFGPVAHKWLEGTGGKPVKKPAERRDID